MNSTVKGLNEHYFYWMSLFSLGSHLPGEPCDLFLLSINLIAISSFSTLLCHVYFSMILYNVYLFHTPMLCLSFYAVAPCLIFPRCCTVSAFSTLLPFVYSFHAAAPCLHFPRCCAMSIVSTKLHPVYFSTLLCHVYFFNACAMSPFYAAVLCCVFYSTLLCCVDCSDQSLLSTCCALSTFSTQLCHIYYFKTAVSCLLFSSCCTMSTLSALL